MLDPLLVMGDHSARKGPGNSVPCHNFQTGSCDFPGSHDVNGLFVKHVCAHCVSVIGKEFRHAKKDCQRFKLNNANNESKSTIVT